MGETFVVHGGREVKGEVRVSGSKNAGLPLMLVSLLLPGTFELQGVPHLADIDHMGRILEHLGAKIRRDHCGSLHIDSTDVRPRAIPDTLGRKVRFSFLVIGPLLARFGRATVSSPGGCQIGSRPVDEHVRGLEIMGACVRIKGTEVQASASHGLSGAVIRLSTPTVGGTIHIMLAACRATGTTEILNAAQEPEIVDVAQCLISMGVPIKGIGTDHIVVQGKRRTCLRPYRWRVMEDRIEAATFLILGAMAGTPLIVRECRSDHQSVLINILEALGAEVIVQADKNSITVHKAKKTNSAVAIQTGPYPVWLPTDVQPLLMTLVSISRGTHIIRETIYEERFNQARGLKLMGADIISLDSKTVMINGKDHLQGGVATAIDLRAGASLVLAAVVAHGMTIIQGVDFIDRGYEALETKLAGIGVLIRRVPCGTDPPNTVDAREAK